MILNADALRRRPRTRRPARSTARATPPAIRLVQPPYDWALEPDDE